MSEAILHRQVAGYVRAKYPGVVFRSDQAGVNKSRFARMEQMHLQSSRGYPDFFIAKMVYNHDENKHFGGLFLELKKAGTAIYKRDGSIRASKNNHLQEQADVLELLRQEGYIGEFAVGYEQATAIIDWYMGGCKGHLQLARNAAGEQQFTNTNTGEVF